MMVINYKKQNKCAKEKGRKQIRETIFLSFINCHYFILSSRLSNKKKIVKFKKILEKEICKLANGFDVKHLAFFFFF